jgi:site-specific DNA recombinase
MASVLRLDLAEIYRSKVSALTTAFEDAALRADAFERIRALIESVVMTPEGNELAVLLRGELAAMLELCGGDETQKPPADCSEGVLQIKVVAGVGFEPTTFRL